MHSCFINSSWTKSVHLRLLVRLYRTSRLSLLEVGLVDYTGLSLFLVDVHWFLALCKGVRGEGQISFAFFNQLVRSKFPRWVPQFHLPALYMLIDKALFQLHYEFILIHTGRSDPHSWEASIVENVLDTDCPLQGFKRIWPSLVYPNQWWFWALPFDRWGRG